MVCKFISNFACIECGVNQVTHALIRGNRYEGYREDHLCNGCVIVIKNLGLHMWDIHQIVDIVDLIHPTRNECWQHYFHGCCHHP